DTLQHIEQFQQSGQTSSVGYTEFEGANLDDDDWLDDDFNIGDTIKINLTDLDIISWKEDLTNDLDILHSLLAEMNKVTPEHDEKLKQLKQIIDHKLSNPINPGNRKIIIFSAFTDTVNYLYTHLSTYVLTKYGIH